MSVKEVGEGLVALCKEGKFGEASEKYYAPDVRSIEARGKETVGTEEIRKNKSWWDETIDLESLDVKGPHVNEPFFLVHFASEAKNKKTGEEKMMAEHAVYEVRGDKVASVRFFYQTPALNQSWMQIRSCCTYVRYVWRNRMSKRD